MRAKVQVKLKLSGLNQLMRSAPVQSKVNELAYRMATAAGPGHKVVVPGKGLKRHPWTARAYVQQEDDAATRRDPNGTALLRAIDQVKE